MIRIIASQGAHPAVPAQEIQPIIALEIPVMLVVGHRGVDPPSDASTMKSGRIKLPAQMPVHVVYDHEKEENKEMKLVQRQ